jgi:hypothetical protein
MESLPLATEPHEQTAATRAVAFVFTHESGKTKEWLWLGTNYVAHHNVRKVPGMALQSR